MDTHTFWTCTQSYDRGLQEAFELLKFKRCHYPGRASDGSNDVEVKEQGTTYVSESSVL
ncbi:MAG: hypothetical protein IPO94_06785 [Saprospiraceae bacterium]|nr:hypothetical protein [Saprospiraceae bacterium]